MDLFLQVLLASGDEARLLSQLLFSFFFKPGAGPSPLFPQNPAVTLFLFLAYGPPPRGGGVKKSFPRILGRLVGA